MKKISNFLQTAIILSIIIFTAAGFSACTSGGAADTITGSAEEVLNDILLGADELLPDDGKLPPNFIDPVTEADSEGMLGLSPEDFGANVTEAYAAKGALTVSAYEVAVVKCKDAEAAASVKNLIANGFDSGKWICVMPEESFVIDSGSYVLLAAASKNANDAIKDSFSAIAGGNLGEKNAFFENS